MTTKKNDGGAAEVQAITDEAEAKGYFGTVPDPFPNSAYSLESGPDSPTQADVADAVAAVVTDTKKEAGDA